MHRNHRILFLVLSLICFVTPSQFEEDFTRGNTDWISRVIISLNKVVDFFRKDYDSVNLDGVFGLRVAEGMYLCCHLNHHILAHTAQFYQDKHNQNEFLFYDKILKFPSTCRAIQSYIFVSHKVTLVLRTSRT